MIWVSLRHSLVLFATGIHSILCSCCSFTFADVICARYWRLQIIGQNDMLFLVKLEFCVVHATRMLYVPYGYDLGLIFYIVDSQ